MEHQRGEGGVGERANTFCVCVALECIYLVWAESTGSSESVLLLLQLNKTSFGQLQRHLLGFAHC